jgi:hypothetical protein
MNAFSVFTREKFESVLKMRTYNFDDGRLKCSFSQIEGDLDS